MKDSRSALSLARWKSRSPTVGQHDGLHKKSAASSAVAGAAVVHAESAYKIKSGGEVPAPEEEACRR